MPVLIDKVRIYNFRSIKKCEVTLTPLTLLIGANNSGKTSFLKALNVALGLGAKRITKEDFYIGETGVDHDSKEIIIDIRITPVEDNYSRVEEFDDSWRDKQFGELINFDDKDNEYFSFRTKISYDLLNGDYLIKRYKIKTWADGAAWETEEDGEELKHYFVGFPLFFIDAQRDILQDLRERSSYFGRIISNMQVDKIYVQEIEEKIKEINDTVVKESRELEYLKKELEKLRDTVSTSYGIEITAINKKFRDIGRNININLQDTASESFTLDYHGMGTRSWASLLTYGAFISWQYKNREAENEPYHTILALEEPEAHLHPHAQRSLYCQLTNMKGQKIISTHSPFIASQCDLSEIRHFKKRGADTEIKMLNIEELKHEETRRLKREVLNTRGEMLFAKAVVLFEGETEEQAFPIFAEKYWENHPYALGISFIGVGGGGNYAPYLYFLHTFEIPWYLFSDGEENTIKKVDASLEKIGINSSEQHDNIFVLEGGLNFESYLVAEGYQEDIKAAILEFEEMNGKILGQQNKSARKSEIGGMADGEIIQYMKSYKTKLSPIYAKIIAKNKTPDKIRALFDIISSQGGMIS